MNVSIIIVSYNTKALLKQCLISVFEETHDINFEVIVVDNISHDGSQQMIRDEFPNVLLIESPENLGFGRANNLGAKYAQGKYLFLLNPDTIVLNNAVKILADFLDNNPEAGICGGNVFKENKKPSFSYEMLLPSILWELNKFLPYKLIRLLQLLHWRNSNFNHTGQTKEVGYIVGADLMINRNLFNQLNGFDPDFFLYYEETELTFRVRKAGYKIFSVPQAEIIHLDGQTFSGDWQKRNKISMDGRKIYYLKTHNRVTIVICDFLYWLNLLLKCIQFKVIGDTQKYLYFKYLLKIFNTH
jgi:GT2 family glycosyltransferase